MEDSQEAAFRDSLCKPWSRGHARAGAIRGTMRQGRSTVEILGYAPQSSPEEAAATYTGPQDCANCIVGPTAAQNQEQLKNTLTSPPHELQGVCCTNITPPVFSCLLSGYSGTYYYMLAATMSSPTIFSLAFLLPILYCTKPVVLSTLQCIVWVVTAK